MTEPDISQRAREKAERLDIPYRKALSWAEPYDFDQRVEFLRGLPEYEIVDLRIGGIIAVEDKHG